MRMTLEGAAEMPVEGALVPGHIGIGTPTDWDGPPCVFIDLTQDMPQYRRVFVAIDLEQACSALAQLAIALSDLDVGSPIIFRHIGEALTGLAELSSGGER